MAGKFSVIGAGKVGVALSIALKETGFSPLYIVDRNKRKAVRLSNYLNTGQPLGKINDNLLLNSKFILLTVGDDEISRVMKEIKKNQLKTKFNNYFFHTSGNLPASVISIKGLNKKKIGSFHPIQTFNKLLFNSEKVRGIYYGLSGGNEAILFLKKICKKLDSDYLIIPDKNKIAYHLLCVIASNFVSADYLVISKIIEKSGFKNPELLNALIKLSESTLQNIKTFNPEKSISGPVSRGDFKTVSDHISLIASQYTNFMRFYKCNSSIIEDYMKNSNIGLKKLLK